MSAPDTPFTLRIPDLHNLQGPDAIIGWFTTREEALKYAQEVLGADAQGRLPLIVGPDEPEMELEPDAYIPEERCAECGAPLNDAGACTHDGNK